MLGVIREDYMSKLEDYQLLVKIYAWIIKSCDAILQDLTLSIVIYLVILGPDVAGIVEEVGVVVASKSKVRDRVFDFSCIIGFKHYVTFHNILAAKIPDSLSFNDVSVFPLCVIIATFGLFRKNFLALPFFTLNFIGINKSILIL